MYSKTTIHGYLGRDPELKDYKKQNGEIGKLCNLSVGVSRVGDGTDWYDVTIFGKRAEVVDKWFKKGSQILISGRMQSDTVDKGGQKRKYWKLVADDFDFCDSKNGNGDSWEQADTDCPF